VIKRATAVVVLAISTAAPAAPKLEADDLPGPKPEIATETTKVDVPPPPAFELPAVEPGLHGPRELRVHGKPLLGTEIEVKGYVTWIYSCAASLAATNPKATPAQIATAIDNDPTLCERPKFYLGDARTTSPDASIWVVDVPRPPSKNERDRLGKARSDWPAVPKIAVGDLVAVTGTWATQSSHGEHNTNGFLVYRALAPAPPSPAPSAARPAATAAEPELALVTKAPLRPHVSDDVRNASVGHMNACIKAINARQFDAGITECEAAVKAWDGNHLAWYTLASAHMARSEWPEATAAVDHAVTQRPDQGMYQLYYGISLYESLRQAKDPKAAGVPTLDQARDALRRATKLAPDLWRAHYYLGRAYRDVDDARRAAEQFAQTIATHPSYPAGYVALCELYHRWDYIDEALGIAKLGTANVAASDSADVWFELGMAYDAKHADPEAIDAFGKAIAGKPDDPTPKFQRGQLYAKHGDVGNARRDLEDVVKSNDPRSASMKPLATQLLAKLGGKAP
jgi:tetratricopeptide (TPR) repeat protein